MTPQEQQMLDGLIDRVRNAQLTNKDADADRSIQAALGRDPNALYVLCQTVLVQGYALDQAQKQLAAMRDKLASQETQVAPQHQPSFLEKIFGAHDPEPHHDAPVAQPSQNAYGTPVYSGGPGSAAPGETTYMRPGYGQQPPPAYYPAPAQPGYGTPYAPYGQPVAPGGMGGGGFLQGALQTAAGVAIGEMAFRGVEDLFRGFGREAGYGSDRAMGFGDVSGGQRSDDDGQSGGFFSREQAQNGVNDTLSPDIEDRRGDTASFADAGNQGNKNASGFQDTTGSYDDSATDSGYDVDNSVTEDNGSDFSSADDSGSFDDGGGSDDGGFSDNN